jgi:hypothetical protein
MPTAQPEETIIDETTLDLTYAHVVHVVATEKELGMWRFDVTLRSGDTGWDKYADQWEVLGPDGEVLATRVLMHPHVDEQPFTRSLDDVVIPSGVTQVTVLARDSVAGYGGQQVIVDLAQASGPGYEVHRQPEE